MSHEGNSSEKKKLTTETSFDDYGTLPPPGPVGRLVRLGSGLLCAWGVWNVWMHGDRLLDARILQNIGWEIMIVGGIMLVPYVVNIGLGLSWRFWPRVVSVAIILGGVTVGWALDGTWWNPAVGWSVRVWLLYIYGHLGISFLLSGLIATPGCEMRTIPHLWTLMTGRKTKEHYCPVFLENIDAWELNRGRA